MAPPDARTLPTIYRDPPQRPSIVPASTATSKGCRGVNVSSRYCYYFADGVVWTNVSVIKDYVCARPPILPHTRLAPPARSSATYVQSHTVSLCCTPPGIALVDRILNLPIDRINVRCCVPVSHCAAVLYCRLRNNQMGDRGGGDHKQR